MTNVIQFPARGEWDKLEAIYRNELSKCGADSATIDAVCVGLRDVHGKWIKSLDIDMPADENVAKVARALVDKVGEHFRYTSQGLMFEIMLRELELYKFRS